MRFREFKTILEFVQEPSVTSDPAADLEYLITNTELTPTVRDLIAKTVKGLIKQQELEPQEPVEPQQVQDPQNVQQPQTPPPIKPKAQVGEPMGQDPEDEEQPMYEAKRQQSEEAELLAYISNVQNKAKLGRLLYVVKDEQFKILASKIVKKKIKFKPRESYELIKTKIRSLSTRVPVAVMTDFLNTCLESGVIDTLGMVSGDVQSTQIPLTDQKYRGIAEAFLSLNLERLGKGEIGLAFMGIDAVKETSDISIAGIPIEVKASSGTDFYMKGNPDEGGFGHQTEALKILVKALNDAGAKYKSTNRSKQGGIAALGKTNTPILNQYFSVLGHEGTYNTLVSVLKELNKKAPEIVDKYSKEIENAIGEDGTIDYAALSLATAKINYEYYQLMSHHEGVLILNLGSFQFVYITDSQTFAELVGTNVLQQMYAIDFRSNGLGGVAYTMNSIQD